MEILAFRDVLREIINLGGKKSYILITKLYLKLSIFFSCECRQQITVTLSMENRCYHMKMFEISKYCLCSIFSYQICH